MTVKFFLYLTESGDIIFTSEAAPVNSDWQESGVVAANEGEIGGVNWDIVAPVSSAEGITFPEIAMPDDGGPVPIIGLYRYDPQTGAVSLAGGVN